MEIDRLIRWGRYPNKPWLARHFEKSQRTIERDFENMRDLFGLPALYSQKHNVFYYEEEPGFDPEQYLAGSFGMFGHPHPEPIHLRFTKAAARRVKEREWHPTQRLNEKSNGSLEMRLDATVNIDLDRWLWGLAGEVELLAPGHLREWLRKAGEAVAKRNGGGAFQ